MRVDVGNGIYEVVQPSVNHVLKHKKIGCSNLVSCSIDCEKCLIHIKSKNKNGGTRVSISEVKLIR